MMAMAIHLRCHKDAAMEYKKIERRTLLQQLLRITSETEKR
jgi:hypothetical protein